MLPLYQPSSAHTGKMPCSQQAVTQHSIHSEHTKASPVFPLSVLPQVCSPLILRVLAGDNAPLSNPRNRRGRKNRAQPQQPVNLLTSPAVLGSSPVTFLSCCLLGNYSCLFTSEEICQLPWDLGCNFSFVHLFSFLGGQCVFCNIT